MTIIDKIKNVPIPEEFNRSRMSELYAQALLGELSLFREEIGSTIQALNSEQLSQLIDTGNVTLAAIKPDLESAIVQKCPKKTDTTIAAEIQRNIADPLKDFFSISMVMTDQMVEEWYAGSPKTIQLAMAPLDPNRYGLHHETRWDEFKASMIRGPFTFLLLYSETGKAVEEWRSQVGNHRDIEVVRQQYPNSLRARYMKDGNNNLLHGSDSSESVKREIKLLCNFLGMYIGSNQ